MRWSLAAVVLAIFFPPIMACAHAEPQKLEFAAAIGRQGFGRCHMDECGFFIIDASSPIGANKSGALFAISFRSWDASYRPTDDGREYDRKPISMGKPENRISLVYCSKTDPVIFDFLDGKWEQGPLRPGDDEAIFGANESSYTFYYAACHNYITKDANLPAELAKKLGYNLHGGFPDGVNGPPERQPLDMLK